MIKREEHRDCAVGYDADAMTCLLALSVAIGLELLRGLFEHCPPCSVDWCAC